MRTVTEKCLRSQVARFGFKSLLLACAACGNPYPADANASCSGFEDGLRVSVLNVGLGESLLITCPGGHTQTLIDAGDTEANYPGAENLFARALREAMGDDRHIETALLSHPHPDHMGGFLSLFQSISQEPQQFSVGRFIEQETDFPDSEIDEQVRSVALEKGISRLRYSELDLCPGSVETKDLVLSQAAANRLGCPANLNDCSIKLRLSYQGVSFLLLGDATSSWEHEALLDPKLRALLPSTMLKAGHHASSFSSEAAFLQAVAPRYIAVSAGEPGHGRSDELGYPALETVSRLKAAAASAASHDSPGLRSVAACRKSGSSCQWTQVQLKPSLFATSVDGTITFYAKGGAVCVTVEHTKL